VLSIARLFNLGYDVESKVLIIPIREQQGSIVSIVRRFLETGHYVNELGWSRGEFLYGEQFFNVECPNVYIVEGYFDVWRLYALGYTNVYAIMGNKISDRQAAKIAAFGRNTFVIPDKDKGGEELVVSARTKLIRLGVPLFTNQPLQSDPCYYTKEELEKFIQGSFRLFE
jgi:DNA primase